MRGWRKERKIYTFISYQRMQPQEQHQTARSADEKQIVRTHEKQKYDALENGQYWAKK